MSGLVKNIGWSLLGQISNVFIIFFANLVLALFLTPEEFGRLSIVMFFVTISNIFSESGFGGALVRKIEISDYDYSTAFIFNSIISVILCAILILFSGMISSFYNDNSLSTLISFSCLIIVFNGLGIVQNAKGYRELKFKQLSLISIFSAIIGATVAIIMAWKQFGIWSLLSMYVVISFVKSLLLWHSFGTFHFKKFNRNSFTSLFNYGIYTTFNSLLNNGLDNIFSLILPKYFSNSVSGLYYQGKRIQSVPYTIFNTLALSVFFSHLVKFQTSLDDFKKEYLKILAIFLLVLAFFSGILFILSDLIVSGLFNSEWAEVSVFIKLLIPMSFLIVAKVFSQNVLKIFNKTKRIFFVEVLGALLQLLVIFLALEFNSLTVVFIMSSISVFITFIILSYQSWTYLKTSFVNDIVLLVKLFLISITSLIISYSFSFDNIGLWGLTFFRLAVFSVVFLSFSNMFFFPLNYLVGFIKQIKSR